MARGIDRTELLELLAETVNNENPMLHLMEFFLGHLMEAEVEVIVGQTGVSGRKSAKIIAQAIVTDVSTLVSGAWT